MPESSTPDPAKDIFLCATTRKPYTEVVNFKSTDALPPTSFLCLSAWTIFSASLASISQLQRTCPSCDDVSGMSC